MSDKELEICVTLIRLCEEILPKTSMQNNQKVKDVLNSIKENLDA